MYVHYGKVQQVWAMHGLNVLCLVSRGTIGVHDMTVGESCSLYLGNAGTTARTGLVANPGLFYFESLTVAAGGEITSTPELTGASDEIHLKVSTPHTIFARLHFRPTYMPTLV